MSTGIRKKRRIYSPWLVPPDRLGVVEFAYRHLLMPEGRATGSPMRLAPFQVGIIEAFDLPGVEIVVVQCSAQVGKSTIALALIGHAIGMRGCSMLYVVPTERPMGEAFARERLDPMIRNSPRLAIQFRGSGGQGAKAKLSKIWPGGSLAISGANSPASLAARAVERLLLDEIDKYPDEIASEGDVVKQAERRTETFGPRRSILKTSTPARSGGRIEKAHALGDRRRWVVLCPHCGRPGPILWDDPGEFRIVWVEGKPATAAVLCPDCGAEWSERDRLRAIELGEWVAQCAPADDRTRSFWLWAGSAPYARLSEIVRDYEEAQEAATTGEFSKLRAWTQLTLGLPFDDDLIGDRLPEIQQLRAGLVSRAGHGAAAPADAIVTVGFDVQANRVEGLVCGWGAGEECWIDERLVFYGDPVDPSDDCWSEIGKWIREARPAACSMDSKYITDAVLEFVEKMGGVVMGTYGHDQGPIVQMPKLPDPIKSGRRVLDAGARTRVARWRVGTNNAKRLAMHRLARAEPGPGFVHIPGWFDEADARQLVSEREVEVIDKYGRKKRLWEKVSRRNELLDMFILALHARRRHRSRG